MFWGGEGILGTHLLTCVKKLSKCLKYILKVPSFGRTNLRDSTSYIRGRLLGTVNVSKKVQSIFVFERNGGRCTPQQFQRQFFFFLSGMMRTFFTSWASEENGSGCSRKQKEKDNVKQTSWKDENTNRMRTWMKQEKKNEQTETKIEHKWSLKRRRRKTQRQTDGIHEEEEVKT
jgi:hypothetical protein